MLPRLVIAVCLSALPAAAAPPRTLPDALAAAYASNPTLAAARAQLRGVDEGVPTALAGWRPSVILSGGGGYAVNHARTAIRGIPGGAIHTGGPAPTVNGQIQLTQPVFTGGGTVAATRRAQNQVYAQRARLIATEQQILTNAISAYVAVYANAQTLALNLENERAYAAELTGTRVRFKVGDVTLTDIAQAEAALAGATGTRRESERDLATARATFRQIVGQAPGDLVPPQPLRLPARTVEELQGLAATNSPALVAALFAEAAAKDLVDVQFAALLPSATVTTTPTYSINQGAPNIRIRDTQTLANVTVPVYAGGAEYAAVRQARQSGQQSTNQVIEARRTAMADAVSAWAAYTSAIATGDSARAQLRANEVALEGVRREMIAGNRTTLDLLNAQQATVNARLQVVRSTANTVNASYAIAASAGRLTARDLVLPVPLYDETAYYKAVRNAWAGTGDPLPGR